MLDVALTGPIGAGKSAVASLLADAGIPVIDADGISRELTAPGGILVPVIDEAFPGVVHDGHIDRAALADRVFHDDNELSKLNGLTHPVIGAEIARRKSELDTTIVVTDIPLIVEQGRGNEPAVLIVVDATEEIRIQRLMTTRGMTEAEAKARMQAQAASAERNSYADIVIVNNASLDDLSNDVRGMTERLTVFADAVEAQHQITGVPGSPADAARMLAKLRYHGGEGQQVGHSLRVTEESRPALTHAGFIPGKRWVRPDPLAVIEAEVMSAGTVA